MRISTPQMFRNGVSAILDQQARLAKTQLQVATGKRVLSPSDDPASAARALAATETLGVTAQLQVNADMARTRLSVEEGTLQGVTNLLQRARELAVQSGDAALDNTQRASIAGEVDQLLDELIDLANSRDANGEYLFAGFQTSTMPFVRDPAGGFDYQGDQGQRLLQVGPATRIAVSDSGYEVFQRVRNGNGTFVTDAPASNTGSGIIEPGSVSDPTAFLPNTYTVSFESNAAGELVYLIHDDTAGSYIEPPSGLADDAQVYQSGMAIEFAGIQTSVTGEPAAGDRFTISPSPLQDMFTTLQNFADTLRVPIDDPASRAQAAHGVDRALTDLDQALDHVSSVRAAIGVRLNALDTQQEINSGFELQVQSTLSGLQDLDYAEAISRLNRELLSLEAAQQAFAKTQNLSLFNYLR